VPIDSRKVALALYRSLIDDPFYVTIAAGLGKGTPTFEVALLRYFEYSMDEAAASGKLVVDEAGLGAAVWLLPRDRAVRQLATTEKERFLARALGASGLLTHRQITEFMSRQSRQVVPSPVWYLSILGISPEAQGKGLGRQLIEPTLADADAGDMCCYLETFNARNVGFYERLGFEQAASHVEPTTGARYSIMRRRPRPAVSSSARDPASTA
jgi:ribosomal protein S18 acetylase RimI-like enzyme